MRKIELHEVAYGKQRGLPLLKKENLGLICERCKASLGGHLGYRCIDDKGTFEPVGAEGSTEP